MKAFAQGRAAGVSTHEPASGKAKLDSVLARRRRRRSQQEGGDQAVMEGNLALAAVDRDGAIKIASEVWTELLLHFWMD